MKNLISFITLLIFILSITDDAINTEAKVGSSDPVLDIGGDELRAGYSYRIHRFIWPGGSVYANPMPNDTCAVVEKRFADGLPVIFRPAGSEVGDVIPQSTDLNIMFAEEIVCGPSTVWKVEYDESAQKSFVITGGVAGDETVSDWFKIETYSNWAYKFVFCPKVCESCVTLCSDVGLFSQDNVLRLALTDDTPYGVVFEKLLVGHNRY